MAFKKTGEVTAKQYNEPFTNVIIVGNPSISDTGIVSNFGWQQSIKPNVNISYYSNNSIRITGRFTTSNDVSFFQIITCGTNNIVGQPALFFENNVFGFGCWGTANAYSTKQVLPNTTYDFKFIQEQNIDKWGIYIKILNESSYEHILDYNYSHRSESINNMYIGGMMYDGNRQNSFKGSFDINQFSIAIDNKIIYSPSTNKFSISSYQTTATDFIEI